MSKTNKIILGAVVAAVVIAVAVYILIERQVEPIENAQNTPSTDQSSQNNNQPDNSALTVSQPSSVLGVATSSSPALKNNMHMITIETNYGTIEFTTYDADAPKTVKNFIDLAQKGFYDNLIFHRVIDGFMIQGGDPNCNPSTSSGPCGAGGPGYQFADELNPQTDSYKQGYVKGVVAMANAGPNTNGSQFFIMVADYQLQHDYTIFGKVISGQDVADKIAKVAKDSNDKPLSPVIMKKVTVAETNNQ